jgi:hypothetical protein
MQFDSPGSMLVADVLPGIDDGVEVAGGRRRRSARTTSCDMRVVEVSLKPPAKS